MKAAIKTHTVPDRGLAPPVAPATKWPTEARFFTDPCASERCLSRELTWLSFNRRVLDQARDPGVPILERVKFLAIVSSNLDELFMKKIGGLKRQVAAGLEIPGVDGRTPRQQIVDCGLEARQIMAAVSQVFVKVRRELSRHGIRLRRYGDLTSTERVAIRDHYTRTVLPLLTPLGFDSAHPFPFLSNLSLNLLVALREPNDRATMLARVKVPVGQHSPRFVRAGTGDHFVPLEDVIAHNLDLLFADCAIEACHTFRVIRNASAERDEKEADDPLAMTEVELRDRRFAPFVRLEVGNGMPPDQQTLLTTKLGLDPDIDLYQHDDLLGMADLMELAEINIQRQGSAR